MSGRPIDASREIPILMYHSISERSGPTFTPAEVFRQQMALLAECRYEPVTLVEVTSWLSGRGELPERAFALTFDDAYEDFLLAFDEVSARRWPCTVFVPTGKVGGANDWDRHGKHEPPRLLSWEKIQDLAGKGVEFASHGVSHRRFARLDPTELRLELTESKRAIEGHTGTVVRHLAMPFGDTSETVRVAIAETYDSAFGTGLGRARADSDVYNLPRLEMWYYRDVSRWRALLEGRGTGYLKLRQRLRKIREAIQRP